MSNDDENKSLSRQAEIQFQHGSIPKKFQDRQREAARDRARSWMFLEQTTGGRVCVQLERSRPLCRLKADSQTRTLFMWQTDMMTEKMTDNLMSHRTRAM